MSLPKLRALHYLYTQKRADRALAHCLDFDLIVSGPTLDEAERRLNAIVKLYLEHALRCANYAALSTAAPEKYWVRFSEAFNAGRVKPQQQPALEISVPEVLTLEPPTHGRITVLAATSAAA